VHVALVALVIAPIACEKPTRTTPVDTSASANTTSRPSATTSARSTPELGDAMATPASDAGPDDGGAATKADATTITRAYATAHASGGKAIGHTSVVFKLKLEGGLTAAWKPDSRRGRERYRGEIAARRLAVALGLSNVPEALLRSFSKTELRRVLSPEALELFEAEAVADAQGLVPGALMPWIDGLTFPPLEAEPELSRWKKALAQASTETDEMRALYADLSTLIVFDTVSGNWDRWSGANIGKDPSTGRLLFVDNDGAFYGAPPPDGLARQRRLLAGTKRFSKRFVSALRAFDASRLESVFGTDATGKPLLSPRAVEGVRARLREVLVAIEHGDLDLP
jgi:hypothetical protein